MKNIGIDIDDTITETATYANGLLDGDIKDYHDLSDEEYENFLKCFLGEIILNVKLKDDVVDVLRCFKSKGYKIIFITARGSHIESSILKTALYFRLKEILFDKIIFLQSSKCEACLKENIDIFIDDKENVLDEIRSVGIKTIKMGGMSKKHQVVNSWMELKNIIGDSCE